jgi:D-3-phosphoglycerate dehydrogenase
MRILVTPSSFGECGSEPLQLLQESGLDIQFNPKQRRLSREEVVSLGSDCIGIIAGLEQLDADTLSRFRNLRVVSRLGSGVDNIDLEAAKQKGIVVRSTPYGPTRAAAELTLAMVMALIRNIPMADRNMRQGIWRKEIGQLLQGRIVGILGLGRIGREVARLMIAMGCTVLGHDLVPDVDWSVKHNVRLVDFSDLLVESEILCIHVSALDDNATLIGEKELASMRPGAMLVNMARGGIVDEDALVAALKNETLKGAALDVYSHEPYAGPRTEIDTVVLTKMRS